MKWDSSLCRLNLRPSLYSSDPVAFWDDEYISTRILEAHLDPYIDAASRRHCDINASVRWISSILPPGARVLDVGCGPGLYAQRLADKGFRMVGLDINHNAIGYAEESAEKAGLDIEYMHQNYLHMDFKEEFDAALIIYGELGSLKNTDRDILLERVHDALRPGGILIFDVMTLNHRRIHSRVKDWYFSPGGFWRPGPHFVLQQSFEYDGGIFLLRQAILEQGKGIVVYDLWDHTYEAEEMSELLQSHGFTDIKLYSDLAGKPYREDGEWLGVLCRKA